MITGHVPAVRVPPDLAASRRAAAVPARGSVEGRRDLASAPPAHRLAAASAVPPETDLGGPGPARDPAQRDTESASSGAAVAGHSGHDPALAPRHRPPPMGRPVHARQDRPPGDPPEHQGTGPPAGPGESRMGLPQNPRRVGRPRSEGSGVDGMGDPENAGIDPAPRRTGPTWSQFLRSRPTRSWRATSSQPTCSTAPMLMSWP
jgi:hypothetical protein